MNTKILSGLFGLTAMLSAGLASAATISLSPASTLVDLSVSPNFSITVQGSDFTPATVAGSISVNWDPSLVAMTGYTFSSFVPLALPAPQPDNVLGAFDYAAGTFGPAQTAFDFVTLNFTALVATPGTDLLIDIGTGGPWVDELAGTIDAVTYVGASVTTVVPVPPAVWLFGSGLLGLVGVARRRTTQVA